MKSNATPILAAALFMLPGITLAEDAGGITSTSVEREAGTGRVATTAESEPGERRSEIEAGTGLTAVEDERARQ